MPKTVDVETRIQAVEEYLTNQENTTFRKVAATYGVNEASLGRWIKNELRDNPFNPVNLKHNKKGLKLRAQQDLIWLATSVLPYKWNPHKKEGISIPPDPVHKAMVDLYNRPERFKLGLFPRGTHKTTLLTICGTIQLLLKNPNTTVLIVSEKWNLARKILMEIKAHLLFNKRLREMFGDFMPSAKDKKWKELKKLGGLWNRDWIYIQQRTTFVGMKQPSIGTAGLDCEVTGQHADFQWLDDLVGPKNITTWDQKQKVIDYIDQCIDLASTAGRMFMVGTPWAFDDAYTYAQENWLKQKDGKRKLFAFNCLPIRNENRVSIMPSKYTNEKIDTIYNTKPLFKFACLPGNAKIWMADGTFKKYKDIEIGDIVIGFKNGKLEKSTVLEKGNRKAETIKITLESGNEIICTPDHKWNTRRSIDGKHPKYNIAKVRRNLRHVITPPKNTDINDWRYLAGIIDGEGACGYGSIQISQSPIRNPETHQRIKNILEKLNIPYKIHCRKSYKGHTQSDSFVINGGRQTKVNIINYGNPAKSTQIMNTILERGHRICDFTDKITKIEPHKKMIVYSMMTETGNYVADGYASKNCQYMCDPRAEGNSLFKLKDIERREYGQFDYANANVTGEYDVYITVDPGLSENPKKCWTGITLGIPIYPYDLYIDYSIKMKVKPTPVIEKLLEIVQMPQYMGKVRSIGIEDVAFQEIYWKSLQEELRRLADKTSSEEEATAYRSIWVRGLPAIGSKDNRIYAMEPYFRAGQIHIQKDNRDLLYQVAHYPHISGNNRDLLDALAYIFDILPPLFRANPSAIIRLRDKPVKEEEFRPESEIAHSYTEEMAMAAQEVESW